jgi:uncharacterized protein (DUF2267 family)
LHALRAVLHTLRDRMTKHETADTEAMLPKPLRERMTRC